MAKGKLDSGAVWAIEWDLVGDPVGMALSCDVRLDAGICIGVAVWGAGGFVFALGKGNTTTVLFVWVGIIVKNVKHHEGSYLTIKLLLRS